MIWIGWAKKAGRIFGRKHNVFTDKERKIYGTYIYNGQLNTTLGEFSAGALMGLLAGLGLGLLFGLALISYIELPFFPTIIFFPAIFGLMLFLVFRKAPYYAYRAAVADIERNLIHFIPFLRGATASGVPLETIFDEGSRLPFGHLSSELGKIMGKNVTIRNLSKSIDSSASEIDSYFYKRVMGHIVHARETGVEILPKLGPEEQPLAKAIKALSDEEVRIFGERCRRFTNYIAPIMDLAIIVCIIFPVLLLVLSITSGISGQATIPLPFLKLLTVFIFPLITLLLVVMLAIREPK